MADDLDRKKLLDEIAALRREVSAYRRAAETKGAAEHADHAREELGRSEEKWRSLVEHAADHIIIIDRDHRVLYVNHYTHGFDDGNVIGRVAEDMVAPEHRARHGDGIDHVLETGTPISFEVEIPAPDGTRMFCVNRLGPIYRDGKVDAVCNIVTDITDRRRAEDERRVLEEKLRQSQKMESLALLAGGVAEDFSALFGGIAANAHAALLEAGEGSPEAEAILDMQTAAYYGAQLTKQLQAFAGGARFAKKEGLSLVDVVGEMRSQIEATFDERTVVRFDLEPASPVHGDPSKLRQALLGVIINAAEAIEDDVGIVSVHTGEAKVDDEVDRNTFGRFLRPGRYAFVEVRDTGRGIHEAELPKIFDPFFTTKLDGRGLGLTTALGVVLGHGGAISVSSEPGKGSAFRMLLPVDAEQPDSSR